MIASSSARDDLRSAPDFPSLSSLSSLLEGEGTLNVPVKLGMGISSDCSSSDVSRCVTAATLLSFSSDFLAARRTLPSSKFLKSIQCKAGPYADPRRGVRLVTVGLFSSVYSSVQAAVEVPPDSEACQVCQHSLW